MGDRPVVDQVNVVVRDMQAAVAFYRLLGLELPDGDETWDAHHRSVPMADGVDFDLDSAAFASKWNAGWNGATVVLGFKVASRQAVDERYAALTAAGYRSQQAPHDAFWGARYAIVEDPDGNAVGVMSPIDPDRRSAPPSP